MDHMIFQCFEIEKYKQLEMVVSSNATSLGM